MAGQHKSSGKAASASRLTYAMRDLLLAYKADMEETVREHGLTLPQFRLLKAVSQQSGSSAAAIAREISVTPQTLQAMLTRAVREGWIVRGTSQKSQRILTVSLTAKGQRLLTIGWNAAGAIEQRMWQDVPRKALDRAIEVLECGLQNVHTEHS
jgi:DNA-binding MarR family transcriptional regulator